MSLSPGPAAKHGRCQTALRGERHFIVIVPIHACLTTHKGRARPRAPLARTFPHACSLSGPRPECTRLPSPAERSAAPRERDPLLGWTRAGQTPRRDRAWPPRPARRELPAHARGSVLGPPSAALAPCSRVPCSGQPPPRSLPAAGSHAEAVPETERAEPPTSSAGLASGPPSSLMTGLFGFSCATCSLACCSRLRPATVRMRLRVQSVAGKPVSLSSRLLF